MLNGCSFAENFANRQEIYSAGNKQGKGLADVLKRLAAIKHGMPWFNELKALNYDRFIVRKWHSKLL